MGEIKSVYTVARDWKHKPGFCLNSFCKAHCIFSVRKSLSNSMLLMIKPLRKCLNTQEKTDNGTVRLHKQIRFSVIFGEVDFIFTS